MGIDIQTRRIDDFRVEIPIGTIPDMQVPGLIYADQKMEDGLSRDGSLQQVAQTATLPGAVKASLAMPDIHFGYGFPIGGVLATRLDSGVISPGGVGFDINCGVRLLTTPLVSEQVRPRLEDLVNHLFSVIPTGVGSGGRFRLKMKELRSVVEQGSRWAIDRGLGLKEDLAFTESNGCLEGASSDAITSHAFDRGSDQIGTLGSGNHFIEVQEVEQVYDEVRANAFGIFKGQITVMIHTGSRGLGHQVCTDYLKVMGEAVRKYKIRLPDRQLACAPCDSNEAHRYLAALKGAANYAWANRQCLMHDIRQVLVDLFKDSLQYHQIRLLYDIAHNIVKIEKHMVQGKQVDLAVHRKGATRAFGPGHPDIPARYRHAGQPVLIPGDMGRASFLLAGTERAMSETFGSACHGAGRVLSRNAAVKAARGRSISQELSDKGIRLRASSKATIVEEMPEAYKDVTHVVRIIEGAGIARIVARLRPMGVIKG